MASTQSHEPAAIYLLPLNIYICNSPIADSELNYQQTTLVVIYGTEFEHADSNTLIREG